MRRGLWVCVLAGALAALALPSAPAATAVDTNSETITVQAGGTANGTLQLQPGVTYHAVISGTMVRTFGSRSEQHDAFYCYGSNTPDNLDPGKCPRGTEAPTEEEVALAASYGQGSDIGLGSTGGRPLAYQGTNTYEQDFQVGQPGPLKVMADRLCRPGDTTDKCVSGSFTVQISQKTKPKACKAPWARTRRAPAHAGAINEVHVVAVCPDVQFHKGGTPADAWLPMEVDTVLKAGDEITTDPDGRATLAFADNSTVEVSDTTQLKIGSFFTEGGVTRTLILLKMGQIAAQVCKSCATKSDFRIKSPTGVSSVRGTVFSVFYDPGSRASITSTKEGTVVVTPANRKLKPAKVSAGHEVQVTRTSRSPLAPIGKAGARGGNDMIGARSLVLAVVSKQSDACGISTPRGNAFAIKPVRRGWLVTIKLQGRFQGRAQWRVSGKHAKAANPLAKTVARGCK